MNNEQKATLAAMLLDFTYNVISINMVPGNPVVAVKFTSSYYKEPVRGQIQPDGKLRVRQMVEVEL